MSNPIVYVDSGATGGTYDGTTKATAFQSLATALSDATNGPSAGGQVRVRDTHVEVAPASAAINLASPGTISAPVQILCVNFSTDADSTGAQVTSNSGYAITYSGYAKCRGINLKSGLTLIANATVCGWEFADCTLTLNNTAGASVFGTSSTSGSISKLVWTNVTAVFGSTAHNIGLYGLDFTWKGGSVGGSVFPTTLLNAGQAGKVGTVLIEGVDLSLLSGKTLFASSAMGSRVRIKDCLVPSSFTYAGSIQPACRVDVIRCSNGTGTIVDRCFGYDGAEIESTAITLSGGASDGANAFSRQLTVSAGGVPAAPFVSNDILVWIPASLVGTSLTAIFQGIAAGMSAPSNADIWIEAEYLASSSTPKGGYASSGQATPLATPTAYATTGSPSWSGASGLGANATAFSMPVTFTPQQAGFVTFRVKGGKTSGVFYYDPKPQIPGLTISRSYAGPTGTFIHETGVITQGPSVQVPTGSRRAYRG